jgi:hypothetical protein
MAAAWYGRGVLIRQVCLAMLICILLTGTSFAQAVDIGVFYFPGWLTGSAFWKDLQGLPGSRSPGVAWPEREPLLGFNYPEEAIWVAEKEIEWAAAHGITFFAYDWYWYGTAPDTEHAQQAYLKAKNRNKLKFCLLWANSNAIPTTLKQFDDMVAYWLSNYFKEAGYYRIDGKPAIFIVSPDNLARQSMVLRETPKSLLSRADAAAKAKGFGGIYFIATTNEKPASTLEARLLGYGFNAYTGWNYVRSKDGSRVADYSSMVDTYLNFYRAAAQTGNILPYITPASPGFDDRPWYGGQATVRQNPTPEKFGTMLIGARGLLDNPKSTPRILMIEAWNEFGEGAVIAPTKKWGLKYLQVIKQIFAPTAKKTTK